MQKNKKKFIAFALLALGVVISACLYIAFAQNRVEVVVALQSVRENTPISSQMITTASVEKSDVPPDYIAAEFAQDMLGRYTDIGFAKGQILTMNNVTTGDGKESATIPSDQTLLAIESDYYPEGIVAGDKVNIVISTGLKEEGKVVFTYQTITVTNLYKDVDGVITGIEVRVTPEQAQKIVYAQANGEIHISLLPLNYKDKDLPILDESGFAGKKTSSNNEADEATGSDTE